MSLPVHDLLAAAGVAVATTGAITFATDELPRRRRAARRHAERAAERAARRDYRQVDHDDQPLTDADWDYQL